MLRYIAFFILSLLILGCGAKHNFDSVNIDSLETYTVKDDYGNSVSLREKPKRIMTTHIYLDNILLGLVEPERMLSVSKNMDNESKTFSGAGVEEIKNKIIMPGTETILSLKPDLLVVHDLIGEDKIRMYRDMGIPVYVVRIPVSINEVQDKIFGLSKLVGEQQRGMNLVAKMNNMLLRIEGNIPQNVKFSKSSVLVATNHSLYGGRGCVYDDVCKHAKIRNGISEVGLINGQTVSKEIMLEVDPDYFFLTRSWSDCKADDEKLINEFVNDKSLKNLQAIKKRHVMLIDEKYIFIGHQNCVWSVQKLAHLVYGDCVVLEPEEFLKGF